MMAHGPSLSVSQSHGPAQSIGPSHGDAQSEEHTGEGLDEKVKTLMPEEGQARAAARVKVHLAEEVVARMAEAAAKKQEMVGWAAAEVAEVRGAQMVDVVVAKMAAEVAADVTVNLLHGRATLPRHADVDTLLDDEAAAIRAAQVAALEARRHGRTTWF